MKAYFQKKEYKYIYLGNMSYNFANALIETFGTVMLYKNGIPIWLILLIYGIRFGITGLCTPLFMTISSTIGIAKLILISNFFSVVSSYMMLYGNHQNIVILIIVMGLMGLSNPSSDALSSKYVETECRGRFNSFINITKIIGMALASLLVAWGVLGNHNYILFMTIIVFYFLHYFFIQKIDYKPKNKQAFKISMKYIFKTKNKYKNIYALRATHFVERQFLPLYLFLIVKDFKFFSLIIFASFFFQIITITLIGKYSDKNLSKANHLVTVIKMMITSLFLVFKHKIVISINKMIYDNFEKVYDTSIQTSIQNMIKESEDNSELLSTIGQMCLCFAEVLLLLFLSFISLFVNQKIFYGIFIISIVSTLYINIKLKKN